MLVSPPIQFVICGYDTEDRRTKTDNVLVQFISPDDGETTGILIADAETYGVDKLWVVLRTIPIDVDAECSGSSPTGDDD